MPRVVNTGGKGGRTRGREGPGQHSICHTRTAGAGGTHKAPVQPSSAKSVLSRLNALPLAGHLFPGPFSNPSGESPTPCAAATGLGPVRDGMSTGEASEVRKSGGSPFGRWGNAPARKLRTFTHAHARKNPPELCDRSLAARIPLQIQDALGSPVSCSSPSAFFSMTWRGCPGPREPRCARAASLTSSLACQFPRPSQSRPVYVTSEGRPHGTGILGPRAIRNLVVHIGKMRR
jgi:hypothetical protein